MLMSEKEYLNLWKSSKTPPYSQFISDFESRANHYLPSGFKILELNISQFTQPSEGSTAEFYSADISGTISVGECRYHLTGKITWLHKLNIFSVNMNYNSSITIESSLLINSDDFRYIKNRYYRGEESLSFLRGIITPIDHSKLKMYSVLIEGMNIHYSELITELKELLQIVKNNISDKEFINGDIGYLEECIEQNSNMISMANDMDS